MVLKKLTVAQPLKNVYNVRGNQSFIIKTGFQFISQTLLLYTFKFIFCYPTFFYIVRIVKQINS